MDQILKCNLCFDINKTLGTSYLVTLWTNQQGGPLLGEQFSLGTFYMLRTQDPESIRNISKYTTKPFTQVAA